MVDEEIWVKQAASCCVPLVNAASFTLLPLIALWRVVWG